MSTEREKIANRLEGFAKGGVEVADTTQKMVYDTLLEAAALLREPVGEPHITEEWLRQRFPWISGRLFVTGATEDERSEAFRGLYREVVDALCSVPVGEPVEMCPWSLTGDGSFRCVKTAGHNGLHQVMFGDLERATPPVGEPVAWQILKDGKPVGDTDGFRCQPPQLVDTHPERQRYSVRPLYAAPPAAPEARCDSCQQPIGDEAFWTNGTVSVHKRCARVVPEAQEPEREINPHTLGCRGLVCRDGTCSICVPPVSAAGEEER